MFQKTILFFFVVLASLLVINLVRNGAFATADLGFSLITAAIATFIFNVLYRGSIKKS